MPKICPTQQWATNDFKTLHREEEERGEVENEEEQRGEVENEPRSKFKVQSVLLLENQETLCLDIIWSLKS